jgi:hypothetical protein
MVIPKPVDSAPVINWNETVVIVAVPQWGKTRLLQALAEPLKGNLIVVDTAQRGEWDRFGLPITSDWRDIARLPGLIWRPNVDHVLDWDRKGYTDEWSKGLELIMEVRAPAPTDGRPRGGTTVIYDEMLDSAPGKPHPRVRKGIIQGEGRGLGSWGGAQSPYGISQRFLSAAKHRFAGKIGTAQERGIIEASWGALPAVELPPPVREVSGGGFQYVGEMGRHYGPFILTSSGALETKRDLANSPDPRTDVEKSQEGDETGLQEAARA